MRLQIMHRLLSVIHFHRWPFWLLPILLGAIMLYLGHLFGALAPPTDSNSQRVFNGALAMPIIVVYGWIAVLVMKNRAIHCLTIYTQDCEAQSNSVDFSSDMKVMLRRNLTWSIGIGVSLTCLYLYAENEFASELGSPLFLMNVYAVPFWAIICLTFLQLTFITHYVIKHFLVAEKINLFGIAKLLPVSDLVITNTVISAFLLALIPLFWIGRTVPALDKLLVVFMFALLTCFLFWPVFKVQKIISHKKQLSISRINQSFQALFNGKIGDTRRLTDDAQRLRRLSSLISAKQEIAAASEWPIDLPQSVKGILLSLSIPLSWAAGSIVEGFIARFF